MTKEGAFQEDPDEAADDLCCVAIEGQSPEWLNSDGIAALIRSLDKEDFYE